MSWEATAYIKGLKACPDGAELSRCQKLLLFVLSDYHTTKHKVCWPGYATLAEDALMSLSQVKRDLAYLETHLAIERVKPSKNFGSGIKCGFVILGLDYPDRLREKLNLKTVRNTEPLSCEKGVHGEPFFCPPERGPEGVQEEPKRGSKGVQDAFANKEEPMNPNSTEEQHGKAALKTWLGLKDELRNRVDADEWKLWVRPAYLLKVMGGTQMLVALPPNNRIFEAARARLPSLREIARARGYGVSLTHYPDDHTLDRIRTEYPEFYEQLYGLNRTA